MKKIWAGLGCAVFLSGLFLYIYYPNEKETKKENGELTQEALVVTTKEEKPVKTEKVIEQPKEELVKELKEETRKDIPKIYLEVSSLLQNPELPNGCEIVSLTAVLHYYGYGVSKTTMADTYLPKEEFLWREGKRFGADPYQAYAGNPRSANNGWYSFAPPIVAASNAFMKTQEKKVNARDISGSSRDDLLVYLTEGKPLVVWITLDLSKPKKNASWYIHETGQYLEAYTNLHAVVLHGFDREKNQVAVMNPLKGNVTYDLNQFFNSYEEMGQHAILVEEL